jgi:outer membrane protein assembly factor BamB
VTFSFLAVACFLAGPSDSWSEFRGRGNSVAEAVGLPQTWSDEQGIRWRCELPGVGQSSPVVSGNRVFVTSVRGPNKEESLVACVDRTTGKLLWEWSFPTAQKIADSDYVSRAAPTPAVDAERVYAFFEGGDLAALDHSGRTVWQRNLVAEYGEIKGNHGLGGSPALDGDTLVVLVEHDGPSYLLAVDVATGKNRWKADRPAKVSWTSPIIGDVAGRKTIVVSSAGTVEAFDLADGRRRWIVEGLEGNTVASPTVLPQGVLVGSSELGQTQLLRPVDKPAAADGAATPPAVVWKCEDAAASFSSPLAYGGRVYLVNKAGAAACLDLATGKKLWNERVGSCWASPLGVENRVYFFGKDGTTIVVAAEAEFRKLAENRLTIEDRLYGVAAVDGLFLVRTGKMLYGIGNPL